MINRVKSGRFAKQYYYRSTPIPKFCSNFSTQDCVAAFAGSVSHVDD